eukprot:CAMPEP_0167756364 /NCGR_PEP_ID=MMETSP0110_2-20121227/9346_1 /TAXON_ID=629695 /ORGANISM="Gymnochlora sp., Strain CCMP2014" /LENGTH=394 /DNA_ID=CAMNT_0007642469 /DNA_START=94 /DNA_END=1278 /DNA_ORIENTATION=+
MDLKYEKRYDGLLEKKWTSVTKLAQKIGRLEMQNKQLREDLKDPHNKKVNSSMALPRGPAKHICQSHKGPITCVIFHPVYTQVVTASEDCTIKIWDYEEGDLEKTMKGHIDVVQYLTFNKEGTLLASCSADLTVKVWHVQNRQCIKTMRGHDHTVSCVQFTDSGDRLFSCSRDKTIKIWDVQSGYCLKTIEAHKEWVRQVKISQCSSMFASCSIDHTIKVWDYKKMEEIVTFRDHEHVVESIIFSHEKADQYLMKHVKGSNGKSEDKKSKVAAEKKAKANGTATKRPYTPKFLASCSRDRTIKIFHISSGIMIANIIGHENWVGSIVFHPSGKYLLSGADDKTIRVWDLEKRFRCYRILEDAHDPFVRCIDYNYKKPVLASGGVENNLKIWECH